MDTRILGFTGIKASIIALGSWYLPNKKSESSNREVDREEAIRIIRRAYDLGINFFDTADVYRGVYNRENIFTDFSTIGLSEKILGEALQGYDRESYVISTKVMGRTGPYLNDQGVNRKHVMSAIERSLERLQMKYVDFYIYHAPDNVTSPEVALRTMNILISEGKILHFGLSNFSEMELRNYVKISKEICLEGPAIIQDKLNLIEQKNLYTVIKTAEQFKIASMIYSPLAQGLLAGRYIGKDNGDSRKEYEKYFKGNALIEKNYEKIMKLYEISKSVNIPMSMLSLAWIISRTSYSVPVVGSTKIEQIEELTKFSEYEIKKEIISKIENIFKN